MGSKSNTHSRKETRKCNETEAKSSQSDKKAPKQPKKVTRIGIDTQAGHSAGALQHARGQKGNFSMWLTGVCTGAPGGAEATPGGLLEQGEGRGLQRQTRVALNTGLSLPRRLHRPPVHG